MVAGESWGRWPRTDQRIVTLTYRADALPSGAPLLAYGNGRSYGDVCLNDGGTLLHTRGIDRFIRFDVATGVLECEAGVLLSDIISLTLPHGWFPAVTPGTALVTVGGAIANDVHGKNHHRAGSFGHHLHGFCLRRSDGSSIECSATQNRDWFEATIGGLGLTGLISTASLQLRRVPGPWIEGDSLRFSNLQEFFELETASASDFEYTVAWLDCASRGDKLGRGIFVRGNHAPHDGAVPRERVRRLPWTPPVSAVSGLTARLFNRLYYHRRSAQQHGAVWHYRPFLYPLDAILNWNRLYGPQGFFQYQCVLPRDAATTALPQMLRRIAAAGQGSFLAVLKQFGSQPSVGWLSFPRPGVTLALDFPNRGAVTLALLDDLDRITQAADGAVYPAKDARMSAPAFQQYFPAWRRLEAYMDPRFSSSFWRRVTRRSS